MDMQTKQIVYIVPVTFSLIQLEKKKKNSLYGSHPINTILINISSIY